MAAEEMFELVDEEGRIIGMAPRSQCHGDPSLIHQSVHVMVFDRDGRLFLQKRSRHKDIQPGRWDTSVGGHVQPGEAPAAAAGREMAEELGAAPSDLAFAYRYLWRSPLETELVRTYVTEAEGPFILNTAEIEEGRFWPLDEIADRLQEDIFTPQLRHEFPRIRDWRQSQPDRENV